MNKHFSLVKVDQLAEKQTEEANTYCSKRKVLKCEEQRKKTTENKRLSKKKKKQASKNLRE